jgi:beta-glucosidase
MTRRILLLTLSSCILLPACTLAHAQFDADPGPCTLDFRPISDHAGLPAGAVYADPNAAAEARAADVVTRLSFDEKLALTGGLKLFYFPGVTRLGIPPVYFADATQGIHEKHICVDIKESTAFPSGQALAATWNRDLASRYAAAIGEETRAWGIGVLLGPGLNLYRNSEGGRNFEYFGEDPYLAAQVGVAYIRGMQGAGAIATAKHFIGNEQEFVRHVADVQIGERALREIYLPPFEAAIHDGGVLAVMTGNNLVNGHPGAADTPLEQGVLRDEYGFRGAIMSDWANSMYWTAARQGEEIGSGHSLLMADNALFAQWVHQDLIAHPERKPAIEKALDTMAKENLYSFFKAGIYDRPTRDASLVARIETHQEIARAVADESITLLKNEGGILPLLPSSEAAIAVVGTDDALSVYGGKGSGAVKGYNHVDFLAGLRAVYGDKVTRVAVDDDTAIRASRVVLYMVTKPAGENFDVPFDIPGMTESVDRLASLNPNLIVVFSGGNGFPMPWLPKVKGLLFAYLLGQQRGNALADVISGKISPSGRLPFSIEKNFSDSPAFDYNKLPDGTYGWSGSRGGSLKAQKDFGTVPIRYNEGIYIGYRWYEHKNIAVQFPFGFGLSYTTFRYDNVKSSATVLKPKQAVTVSVKITNTGAHEGKEVVQLYVHPIAPSIDRPTRELKGFTKVDLAPGESKAVSFTVVPEDLRYWDTATHAWKVDHGSYDLLVGASSADIRGHTSIRY